MHELIDRFDRAPVLLYGDLVLDRFVLPPLVDAWIDRLRRHGR